MRSWLDGADEDMVTLRSENTSLKKQVKELEKIISDAQYEESEPISGQTDYLELKKSNEIKIQQVEKESTILIEENKKLTAEISYLQEQQENENVTLNKLKVSVQSLESDIEVAQLGLQQRDEVIQQKSLDLKHAKEMVEEYSTIIRDLRQQNQQLREELEDGKDEKSFAIAIDLMEAKERGDTPLLSFAEELRLLDFSAVVNNSSSDSRQESDEAEPEKLQNTNESISVEEEKSVDICTSTPVPSTEEPKLDGSLDTGKSMLESSRHYKCASLLMSFAQRIVLFLVTFFLLLFLVFLTSGSLTGNSKLFSMDTFWNSARFMLEPYCTLRYGGMPPI